jgi:epoxyqueuosine reductase
VEERVASGGLKEFALSLGFESVGVCIASEPPHWDAYRDWIGRGFHADMYYLREHLPLKEHPQNLLPGAQSVIACSLNYFQPLEDHKGRMKVARYAQGRDYHKVLRGKLRKLTSWIEAEHPENRCRACVDSAPIMERDFAQLAGLGFFGKNTMLIDSRRGSWFFIGLLLTTVPFTADVPSGGGCGSCNKCVEACPTGAIILDQDRWQLDARRCISYLTIEKRGPVDEELRPKIGDWTFGCDVCQEVCPFNQERERQPLRSPQSTEADFIKKQSEWPSLEEVATINEERWDELTRGSALRRAGRDGLIRNAKTNLENLTTSKSD